MIQREIERLVGQEPFEPFRISLISGEYFNTFDPDTVVAMTSGVFIAARDGNWAIFPYSSVASLQSLFEDFHGDRAAFGG